MSDVIDFPQPPVKTDEIFGGCPHCGESDGYLNTGGGYLGVCHEHQTAWDIVADLFSGWREEIEIVNSDKSLSYRAVEPIYPQRSLCPRCNAQTMHLSSGVKTTPHHPLCREPGTDKLSPLSDEAVREAIRYLQLIGYSVQLNPDRLPF